MAQTALTVIDMPGPWATAPSTITWTAGDASNGNSFVSTGREIVLVQNSDGAATHVVTITSTSDPQGRTGDATKTVPISGFVAFQLLPTQGWQQGNGSVNMTVDSASLKFAVIRLPNSSHL